jgi:hypothetical protein
MTPNDRRPWRGDARTVERDALCPNPTTSGPADPSPPEAAGPRGEIAELPSGTITLADALGKLSAILAVLEAAVNRQARPEPLAFRKADAARMCGMSVRLWERLVSAGKAPRPDAHANRCPLWTRRTLEHWLAQGGSR